MTMKTILIAGTIAAFGTSVYAEDISTHVLNIATGQGGGGVPVTLEIAQGNEWREIGSATTQDNGRVEGFGIDAQTAKYRLSFDMSGYDAVGDTPFFPQIDVVFAVQDANRHHHVPVLVSPFGYSTYLGN